MTIPVKIGYALDDLLLVPKYSEVAHRGDVDLSINMGKGLKLSMPVMPAHMKTISGTEMVNKITCDWGGLGILHRFKSMEDEYQSIDVRYQECKKTNLLGASVGVQPEDKKIVDKLVWAGCKIISVDVANGDCKRTIEMTEWIAEEYPEVYLISGNVATGSGALRLYNAGANAIRVGIGNGCFAAGTRILMANATYKNIEDIVPGDRIINKDGKPVNVKRAFSTGFKKVSKLRNSICPETTYVTSDHQYWVADYSNLSYNTIDSRGVAKLADTFDKNKRSRLKWLKLENLSWVNTPTESVPAAYLTIPKKIEFELPKTFSIDILKRYGGNWRTGSKYLTDFVLTPSYDLGYLFGLFIGDGCASINSSLRQVKNGKTNKNSTGNIAWYLGVNEKNIIEKLNKICGKLFNREIITELNKKESMITCHLYHKPLAEYFSSFMKKEEKYLPTELLINDKPYLTGLIEGLEDSDGCLENYGRRGFANTSQKAIELYNISNHIVYGIFPSSLKRKPTAGGLINVLDEDCKPLSHSRVGTTAEKKLIKDYQLVQITELNSDNKLEMQVFDLEIDDESHSFIANNAIVHNSLCSTRIKTGNGVSLLSSLNEVFEASKEYPGEQWSRRKFKIICDGGVKNSGDIVKALVYSDLVMSGRLFSGTLETPGDLYEEDGKKYKSYVGSSTHNPKYWEGVESRVPVKGSIDDVLKELLQGIRSGMSYQGAANLEDLKKDPQFVSISHAGLIESHPHINTIKEI